jgi:hypothetical protein
MRGSRITSEKIQELKTLQKEVLVVTTGLLAVKYVRFVGARLLYVPSLRIQGLPL